MVGGSRQREALLLGGLGAWHPEMCLRHRQELHGHQVRLQLRRGPQTMVSPDSSRGEQTMCIILTLLSLLFAALAHQGPTK